MNYPNRVWEQSGIMEGTELDLNPVYLWFSREPTDEDRLRRRKASLEADKRREKDKLVRKEGSEDNASEPLRRKG